MPEKAFQWIRPCSLQLVNFSVNSLILFPKNGQWAWCWKKLWVARRIYNQVILLGNVLASVKTPQNPQHAFWSTWKVCVWSFDANDIDHRVGDQNSSPQGTSINVRKTEPVYVSDSEGTEKRRNRIFWFLIIIGWKAFCASVVCIYDGFGSREYSVSQTSWISSFCKRVAVGINQHLRIRISASHY